MFRNLINAVLEFKRKTFEVRLSRRQNFESGKYKFRNDEFGIENYFVKEGTGIKLQRDLRNGAPVRVAADKFGKAKVKGFVISESH